MTKANVAIVSAYNDMLSAHQPYETYPALIKDAVKEVGSVAQFAGGVPAMCDGVTHTNSGGHGMGCATTMASLHTTHIDCARA